MKISTLERSAEDLKNTVFSRHLDKVDVTIGLKCLVVLIRGKEWHGDLPSFHNNIPITYLFGVAPHFLTLQKSNPRL